MIYATKIVAKAAISNLDFQCFFRFLPPLLLCEIHGAKAARRNHS